MGRRARRRSVEAPAPEPPRDRAARSEAKDAAARAKLEPLREGERPRAVTVAALVVLAVALVNVGSYIAGVQITGGGRPPLLPLLVFTALLLVAVYGLWRARYWAVLGTQALLVLWILVWALLLVKAENVLGAVISLAIIAGAGTLFWFLIRAMARIQMPTRR